MAISLVAVQDQITTKLKELPQSVYENGVPDGENLEFSNGMMLPFISPFFGSYSASVDGRGITGVRNDLGESYVTVECVGPTERSARLVADSVLDKLLGFTPNGGSELKPTSNNVAVFLDNSSKPTRYICELTFRYAVDPNVVL